MGLDRADLDPIRTDPEHYSLELENDRVRVLRIRYGPREKSRMHGHPEGVGIWLTNAHGRMTNPDGTTREFEAKAGQVVWEEADTHQPENLERQPFELIQIEFKT